MKKGIIIAFSVLFCFSAASASFAGMVKQSKKGAAASKTETITGTITAIDPTKFEVTIKDKATSTDKMVVADNKIIATLKVGDEVKVVLQAGSNKVQSLKKVVVKKGY